jgi:hypothetical protein
VESESRRGKQRRKWNGKVKGEVNSERGKWKGKVEGYSGRVKVKA